MADDKSEGKRCRDCGCDKPTSEFWKSQASSDGFAQYCKPCFKLRNFQAAQRRAASDGRLVRRQKSRTVETVDGMKFCPRCEVVLPIDAFVRNRSTRTGVGTYCRPCQNAQSAQSVKKLYGNTRHYHLKRRYGIGADEAQEMLEEQAARCAICFTDLTVATMHIDHDHATGAVRGVVCFNCNGGLGQFRDDAAVLRRAADYLELKLPRLRVAGPGFVRIVYPNVPQPQAPQQQGPERPPLDIGELRRLAMQG